MEDADISTTVKTTTEISQDLFCPFCGYNLRGLESEWSCPECGRNSYDSIALNDNLLCDPGRLHQLIRGMKLLQIGCILMLTRPILEVGIQLVIKYCPSWINYSVNITGGILWPAEILILIGIITATIPHATSTHDTSLNWLRRIVRLTCVLTLFRLLYYTLPRIPYWLTPWPLGYLLYIAIFSITAFFLTSVILMVQLYLIHELKRLNFPRLSRRIRTCCILMIFPGLYPYWFFTFAVYHLEQDLHLPIRHEDMLLPYWYYIQYTLTITILISLGVLAKTCSDLKQYISEVDTPISHP